MSETQLVENIVEAPHVQQVEVESQGTCLLLNGALKAPGSEKIVNGVSNTPGSEQNGPGGAVEESAMPVSAAPSSGLRTTFISAGVPSSPGNDPIGGADNKTQRPSDIEDALCSRSHSVDDPGPMPTSEYGKRTTSHRGKSLLLAARQHPITGEAPEGLGPGVYKGIAM